MSIKDKNSVLRESPNEINDVFVKYYKELLGSSQPVQNVHEGTIQQWVIIQLKQHVDLLKMTTDNEVRETMFSIHSTQAPGPNGYNS